MSSTPARQNGPSNDRSLIAAVNAADPKLSRVAVFLPASHGGILRNCQPGSAVASPDRKVWVNKNTKVYHLPSDPWYGKTKNGEYMTLAEAEKAGYRASKENVKK